MSCYNYNISSFRSTLVLLFAFQYAILFFIVEVIQTNVQLFTEMNSSTVTSVCNTVNNSMQMRRMSEASLFSNSSGLLQEPLPIQIISDSKFY